jgi:alpha-tubulin suppressor-like RCC1 family protein
MFTLLALVALAGCRGKQRTALVIEVDSNLAVPGEMDKIDIAVIANGKTQHMPYSLIGGNTLPLRTALVETTDNTGTVDIVATGLLNGNPVVHEEAIVGFVEGQALLLKLFLAAECVDDPCADPTKTCTTGGVCVNKIRPPTGLTPFDPTKPALHEDAAVVTRKDTGVFDGAGVSDVTPTDRAQDVVPDVPGGAGVDLGPDMTSGTDVAPSTGTGGQTDSGGRMATGGQTGSGGQTWTGGQMGSGGQAGLDGGIDAAVGKGDTGVDFNDTDVTDVPISMGDAGDAPVLVDVMVAGADTAMDNGTPIDGTSSYILSVVKSGAGNGTVSSLPAGIDCGSVCSASYIVGSTVTLTATPDGTSTFTGWSGACTGTGTCSVAVEGAISVSASFGAGTPCVVQVTAGWGNTCAVRSDGTLWCWGRNEGGQVGDGPTCSPYPCGKPSPVQVTALGTSVVETANVCARKSDGTLWCWGTNNLGQIGDGTTIAKFLPVQVTTLGATVVEVALGVDGGVCARKSDGTLWCWSQNDSGQAGDGTTITPVLSPKQVVALGTTVVQVAVGGRHTCARKSDGTLWCWGQNSNGQLGDGTTTDTRLAPVQVAALGTSVVGVHAGFFHTCARKADSTLWCWGNNANGQLGDGTSSGQSGCGPGHDSVCRPDPLQVTALGTNVVDVVTGGSFYSSLFGHTCARQGDGTLWCWGSNAYGQLGDGTTAPKSSPVQVTVLGSNVVGLAAGAVHTCATKTNGTLWCWGQNIYGDVGDGTQSGQSCDSAVTADGAACKLSPVQVAGLCP